MIWKEIPNFPDYSINQCGEIKSSQRFDRGGNKRKEKLLKPKVNKYGYVSYILCNNEGKSDVLAHRAVALTFIPNLENKPQVNHINGTKTDNRIENLEWCTAQENMIHSFEVLKRKGSFTGIKGIKSPNSKAVIQYDKISYQLIKEWGSMADIQRELQFSAASIGQCCAGIRKSAHGCIWKFKQLFQ